MHKTVHCAVQIYLRLHPKVESAEKEEREGEGGVDEGGVVAAAPQH
jgi:hypothetical protein